MNEQRNDTTSIESNGTEIKHTNRKQYKSTTTIPMKLNNNHNSLNVWDDDKRKRCNTRLVYNRRAEAASVHIPSKKLLLLLYYYYHWQLGWLQLNAKRVGESGGWLAVCGMPDIIRLIAHDGRMEPLSSWGLPQYKCYWCWAGEYCGMARNERIQLWTNMCAEPYKMSYK